MHIKPNLAFQTKSQKPKKKKNKKKKKKKNKQTNKQTIINEMILIAIRIFVLKIL